MLTDAGAVSAPSIVSQTRDPPRAIEAWVDRCRALTLDDPDRGVSASERVVDAAEHLGDERLRARALSALTHALSYAGRLYEALATADRAIEAAEQSTDTLALAEASLTAVQSRNLLGRRDEALALADRAAVLFSSVGDDRRAGTAAMLAGVVLRMLDRPGPSLERFEAASALLALDTGLMAQLDSNRAEALLDLGRFDESEAAFESALGGFRACGQTFGEAIVRGNLADLAARRGRLHDGLRFFREASERFRGLNDAPEAARLDAESAELLLAIGESREPLRTLPAAIETLESAGMQTEADRARLAYGVALGLQGQHDASLIEFDRARHNSVIHAQPLAAAKADALAGEVLRRAGRAGEGIARLTAAMEAEPLAPGRVSTLLLLGWACCDAGRADTAAQHHAAASRLAGELGVDLSADLHALGAALARSRGETEAAEAAVRRSCAAIEEVRGGFSSDRLRAAVLGRRSRAYEEGLALAMETNDAPLAFEMLERAAARTLLEAGDHRESNDSDTDHDVDATRSLLADAQAEGRGEAVLAGLRARLREQESVAAAAEMRGSWGAAAEAHTGVMDLESFRAALPEDAAVVSIGRHRDRLVGLAGTRGSTRLVELGLSYSAVAGALTRLHTDIDRALARLSLGRRPSDRLDGTIDDGLEYLGEGLLGPFLDELASCRCLLVSLPRGLSALPLPALVVGGGRVVEHAVPLVVPSCTWSFRASRDPSERTGPTLLAGIPDEHAPAIADEIRSIAAEASSARVLLGAEAGYSAIEAGVAEAGVFHLSCHGEYTPEDPMGSRVRLGDGWVSARRLAALRLRGASVVLSGCETGFSDAAHAGEHFGLVRPMLTAGASCVVAAGWRLLDDGARGLFVDLHRNLSGMPLADALAGAQRVSIRRQDHLALWGALRAVGSWA